MLSVNSGRKKSACDIKFILLSRLIFDQYYDVTSSSRIRWLAKSYCVFVTLLSMYLFFMYARGLPTTVKIYTVIEYLGYSIFSLTNGKFVTNYYTYKRAIDGPSNSQKNKSLRTALILIFTVSVFLRSVTFVEFCITNYLVCFVFEPYGILISNVVYAAIDLGRFTTLLIFLLTFYRAKLIRMTLEAIGFDNTPQTRLNPEFYIHINENVMDNLRKVERKTKYLFILFCACSFLRVSSVTFTEMANMRKNGPQFMSIIWYLAKILLNNLAIIVSAVALDMMSEEVDAMKLIVLEKRIASMNERERGEIQKLFQFLRGQPLCYSILGAPLTIQTLLTFQSFSVTTMISMLQLKNTNNLS